jgi:hypothetical protein
MQRKVRVSANSLRWLIEIDRYIREHNIRGSLERFRDVASDVLDSWALRSELADLVRRRLLTVVCQGFDDSRGRDPLRDSNPDLCGVGWSVNPTERLIHAIWPDRVG